MEAQRQLSPKAEEILSLIAKGNSYDQIARDSSGLTYQDIFRAAAEALVLEANDRAKSVPFEHIRSVYPRGYEKWTQEEEQRVTALYAEGRGVREIAELLGRQPGAISSRLARLGLIQPRTERKWSVGSAPAGGGPAVSRLKELVEKRAVLHGEFTLSSGEC